MAFYIIYGCSDCFRVHCTASHTHHYHNNKKGAKVSSKIRIYYRFAEIFLVNVISQFKISAKRMKNHFDCFATKRQKFWFKLINLGRDRKHKCLCKSGQFELRFQFRFDEHRSIKTFYNKTFDINVTNQINMFNILFLRFALANSHLCRFVCFWDFSISFTCHE